MIWFIFIGDMLVMAFMIGLAIWFTYRGNDESMDYIARIPLQDSLDADEQSASQSTVGNAGNPRAGGQG